VGQHGQVKFEDGSKNNNNKGTENDHWDSVLQKPPDIAAHSLDAIHPRIGLGGIFGWIHKFEKVGSNRQLLFLLNLPALVHDPSNDVNEQSDHKLAESYFNAGMGHRIQNLGQNPIQHHQGT
jgi:hypothetical protein